jgi:hypothetical protein
MITSGELSILFPDGLTPEWKYCLYNPQWVQTFYYDKNNTLYGVVTMGSDEDGVLLINSGSVNNQPFTVGMLRQIIKAAKSFDKVIVSSSKKDSSFHRLGTYDEINQCFHKGL